MSNPTMIAKQDGRLLNQIIESFEESWTPDRDTQVDDFLPERSHADYNRIAIELMRVDMERNWQSGVPKPLDDYRKRFTDVLSDPVRLGQLAFEEYRQRLMRGQTVRRDEYQAYGIDTDAWPVETKVELDTKQENRFGSVDLLRDEVMRLADATCEFPTAGETFAGLQIKGQIGQGAFARVYLARQDELANRFVVLKVSATATGEHERLAQLQHTNIVPIFSVHRERGLMAICMPLYGINTLADVLRSINRREVRPTHGSAFEVALKERPSPSTVATNSATIQNVTATATHSISENCDSRPSDSEPQDSTDVDTRWPDSKPRFENKTYVESCILIAHDVATALQHAFGRGILHRDLKPANVLLTDSGIAMLLDFNVSDDVVPGGTASLAVAGTLPYMSTEQLRAVISDAKVDQRSDVYSFGILLFELLSGKHPFKAHSIGAERTLVQADQAAPAKAQKRSITETVHSILAERDANIPDVRDHNPEVPIGISKLVNRCMQPRPEDRYPSVHALQFDLNRHLENLPLSHVREPLRERSKKWARRHPRLSSASTVAAIAMAAMIGVVSLLVWRSFELKKLEAEHALQILATDVPILRAELSGPSLESAIVEDGRARADRLLKLCRLDSDLDSTLSLNSISISKTSNSNSRKSEGDELSQTSLNFELANRLPPDQATRMKLLAAELLFLKANSLVWNSANKADELNEALKFNARAQQAIHPDTFGALAMQRSDIQDRLHQRSDVSAIKLTHQLQFHNDNDRVLAKIQETQAGNWQDAVAIFEDAVEKEPQNFANHFILAVAYFQADRMVDAERSNSVCVTLSPKSYCGYLNRGLARAKLGKTREAIQDFNRVIELKPDSYVGYANRAVAQRQQGDLEAAENDLNEAIKRRGNMPRLDFLRADVREQRGKLKEAANDRERGLAKTPVNDEGWQARGFALLKRGEEAKTLEAFAEALRRYPNSLTTQWNIGWFKSERSEDLDGALKTLDGLTKRAPENAKFASAHAVLLARAGETEAAYQEISRALKLDRNDRTLFQAACVYALTSTDREDEIEGRRVLAEAQSKNPSWLKQALADEDLKNIHDSRIFRKAIESTKYLHSLIHLAQDTGPDSKKSHAEKSIKTPPDTSTTKSNQTTPASKDEKSRES